MQFNYSNTGNYLAGAKQVADISTDLYDTSQKTGTDVNKLVQTESKARKANQISAMDKTKIVGNSAVNIQTGVKLNDMQSKLDKDLKNIKKGAQRMAGVLGATNAYIGYKKYSDDLKIDQQESADRKQWRADVLASNQADRAVLKPMQQGVTSAKQQFIDFLTNKDKPVATSNTSISTSPSTISNGLSTSGEKSPGWSKLSKVIKTGEGTLGDKGYTTMFTGAQFSDLSKHPAQINVSGKNRSDAAGAYQFLSTTYNPAASKLGITDFSPESQEKVGKYLAQQRGIDVDKVHTTKESFLKALDKISPEWASMPTLKTGTSFYGQGGLTPDEAWSIYNN